MICMAVFQTDCSYASLFRAKREGVCVCVCVGGGGGDSGGPDLLDSKQLIHYSKQALSLSANPSPSPLHQLFIGSVDVKTLQKSR